MRVLEFWTQVQPNSTEALSELARFSRVSGSDAGLERASLAYDRLLEEALATWADADPDFIHRREAQTVLRGF